MFDGLFNKLTEWIKEGLIDGILSSFTGMFDSINEQVGEIAGQVGSDPESWNSGIYTLIRTLSETVVIPVAGMILTFVMCYELISLIIDRNNMHDVDTWLFFKWIFKTYAVIFILTHTFDIVMGVFGLAQSVVNDSAGIISGSLDIGGGADIDALRTQLEAMGVWELLGLYLETAIVSLCTSAMSICVFIVVYGRMIEIYMVISLAPVPLSTMANKEWGQMGNNYLKSLFALAFQGFLIMVCVAIYSVMVQGIVDADNIHAAIWLCAGYTVLLCYTLFRTGSLSKSIFGSH
ncbi:MAG: hypothetical protein LBS19_05275 [Clostridiales bacterium]|jgi:hypothetical protein|nr:hypothetical protein [Clostridiales bacterium]